MKHGQVLPLGIVQDCWQLVEEKIISTAVQSVTFSGLDGDVDEIYLITASIKKGSAGGGSFFIQPNSDSGVNYSYQFLRGVNVTVSAGRATWTGLGFAVAQTTGYQGIGKGILMAKSGVQRHFLAERSGDMTGTTINDNLEIAWLWSNTGSNITSLLFSDSVANGIGIGSYITLYKKVA